MPESKRQPTHAVVSNIPRLLIESDSCRWSLASINEFKEAEGLGSVHVLIRSYDVAKDNGSTMPMFMCRWRNGDPSFVFAANEDDAMVQLDEWGNADHAELTLIKAFHGGSGSVRGG